jgi:hypothetical protein
MCNIVLVGMGQCAEMQATKLVKVELSMHL